VSDRPDVKAAVARVDAARASLEAARAARKSDVDITLGFDHWPVSATNTQGTGNSFTIGASMPIHVFDSGRGPVGHAVADVFAAESDLQHSRAAAEIEIRTAQEELANAQALTERYRTTLLPESTRILDAEEIAFRRGGASLLDLLDARRNARQVALAAVAARRDREIAAARLELASGHAPLAAFLNPSAASAAGPQNPQIGDRSQR
jgi:cobalt-zinc-cadmium efflux system outer membrane protein